MSALEIDVLYEGRVMGGSDWMTARLFERQLPFNAPVDCRCKRETLIHIRIDKRSYAYIQLKIRICFYIYIYIYIYIESYISIHLE